MENTKTTKAKTLTGTITSTAMDKTIVVRVERYVKHPKYKKYYRKSKKYSVHAPEGEYKVGDKVTIESCRPISKTKRFVVAKGA